MSRGAWFGAVALVLVVAVAGVLVGQVAVPLDEVSQVIATHLFGTTPDAGRMAEQIVWDVRLPRVLAGIVVGIALAVTGVVIQAVVRNPLGDAYVIGVTPGASLGAVAAIVLLGAGSLGITTAAFTGAIAAFLVIIALARRGRGWMPGRVILSGVAIGYLLGAATYFLQIMATPTQLQRALFWTLGSVAGVGWDDLPPLVIVTALGCGWMLVRARWLDALAAGPELARSQGVPVGRFQLELMGIAALITACVVAAVGGIGFVGLVIPHAARFLVGAAHRRVLPASLLLGAAFLPAADILARTLLAPTELPIGIITAAVGAPLFIAQLARTDRGAPV
ncbi:FecCD family ABC transporter permease [Microbacterium sp.]|uniref:FecCD family ABC transporter permease n=1 Tax=Microbacterium sp. TaxID=51671 RepID=UPI003C74F1FE